MFKLYPKVTGASMLALLAGIAVITNPHKEVHQKPLLFKQTFPVLPVSSHQPSVLKSNGVNLPEATLQQIKEQIAGSEYFIRWQQGAGAWQSPNRKNNLRATFSGDAVNIAAINPTAGESSFDLAVKAIAANNRNVFEPVASPVVTSNEGAIRFNHNNQFTVEYINNENGIRQNFIVHKKPSAQTKQLSIRLKAAEGWKVKKENNTALLFEKGQQLLTYSDLKVWDATGKTLPAHFNTDNDAVQIDVDAANAVYPVTVDPIVANGTPVNANSFLQTNQNYAVVTSVSGAGDVNGDGYDDVVVGSYFYDNGESSEGAAFVFYGSSRGVNPTTGTRLESNWANANFGISVSRAGDVDNDGYDDIIVGASGYQVGTQHEGAIYVFYGSAAGIQTTTTDFVVGDVFNGQLGNSVASAGDINGDGYADVIAGGWSGDRGQTYEGTAVVYYGGAWGITFTPSTLLEINMANANFGTSVSGAGDVNGDGFDDVIIGADGYANGTFDEGAAFIYYGSSAGVGLSPATTLESNQQSAYYGTSVAGAGDINNDGYDDVIVGAMGFDNGQTDEGAVFVHYGSASGIGTIAGTTLESNAAGVLYGSSVAGAGDINGDGYSDVLVGEKWGTNGQSQEGLAFLYYGRPSGLSTTYASLIESNQIGANLGLVSGAGDVNGDSYDDVIVGSPYYANGQPGEGAAFVYHGGFALARVATTSTPQTPAADLSTSVKAFPSVASSYFTIQFQGLDENTATNIKVINAQGQLMQNLQAGKVKNGTKTIDISRWSRGLYFVEIMNGKNKYQRQIVRQ
jgi:hypothetical protein